MSASKSSANPNTAIEINAMLCAFAFSKMRVSGISRPLSV